MDPKARQEHQTSDCRETAFIAYSMVFYFCDCFYSGFDGWTAQTSRMTLRKQLSSIYPNEYLQ